MANNYKKNFFKSFVQGRLSPKIGSKFQYFPINCWQKEFNLGKKLGFDGIEWIISDYSNPIFNKNYVNEIIKLSKKYNIKISSVSFDLFMRHPLFSIKQKDLDWILQNSKFFLKKLKVNRIGVPIEETSGINNFEQFKKTQKNLTLIFKELKNLTKVSIETDLSPKNIKKLLEMKINNKIGFLLDIGNAMANGYDIKDYFNYFSEKIYGVHIKKRGLLHTSTNKIINRYYELDYLMKNLSLLKNLNDITLQNFRSDNNYIKDVQKTLNVLNNYFKK